MLLSNLARGGMKDYLFRLERRARLNDRVNAVSKTLAKILELAENVSHSSVPAGCRNRAANKRNTGRRGIRKSQRQEYVRSAAGSGVTEMICGSNEKGLTFVRGLKE